MVMYRNKVVQSCIPFIQDKITELFIARSEWLKSVEHVHLLQWYRYGCIRSMVVPRARYITVGISKISTARKKVVIVSKQQ